VQLRRALLAFALVLAAVSLGSALTAPREEEDDSEPPARPAPRTSTPGAVTVSFRQPVEAAPPTREVRVNAHVILRVSARTAGNVEIAGLGLNQSVTPAAPAVFDLLTTEAGRFDVVLLPLTGPERIKLGTLVVG
jgi:hypothetical protein